MPNSFCWLCGFNFPFKGYKGTKYLDEEGNSPCYECLDEQGAFEESEDDAEREG